MVLLELFAHSFSDFAQVLSRAIFFSVAGMPLVLLLLLTGAIAATLKLRFVNVRALGHSLDILRGRYDAPELPTEGQVSPLQALATAISATVGLGNIAGVAIALRLGGPGAAFWMTLLGLLGMNLKFMECTLGQKYRQVQADGVIRGGPMYYLSTGLAELQRPQLGQGLAVIFSIFCCLSTFVGPGMFQVSQSYGALHQVLPLPNWLYGLLVAGLMGWVTLGGASRIGKVAERLVPLMCAVYGLICFWVIGANLGQVPNAVVSIVREAFYPQAIAGGMVGVMVQGFRRAVFSNEAGVGSSAIAHAASRNAEPVREGMVAMLEPLIDTGMICNLTAIAILVTGALDDPALSGLNGAALTSAAFGSVVSWFPQVLAVVVLCFAVSTIISWGYYGETAWAYLWHRDRLSLYRLLFVGAIFVGAIAAPAAVIDLSDAMFLSMALPNLIGLYLLSGQVSQDLQTYEVRLRAGEFELDSVIAAIEPVAAPSAEPIAGQFAEQLAEPGISSMGSHESGI